MKLTMIRIDEISDVCREEARKHDEDSADSKLLQK